MPRRVPLLLASLLLLAAAPDGRPGEALARGDAAWARRAEGHEGPRAAPAPIAEAIAAYAEALELGGGSEAVWKLQRALWFAGEFVPATPEERRRHFARGRDLGRRIVEEAALGDEPTAAAARVAASERPDLARVHFWSAIHWGAWSRGRGLLATVREGVANRLHRLAEASVALDPGVDQGGAQRLLSRLHAELPRVPFVSGWVDRAEALPWAERAMAVAPDHPGSRLVLAEALLATGPASRRAEARTSLAELVRLEPRAGFVLEDLSIREAAARALEAL